MALWCQVHTSTVSTLLCTSAIEGEMNSLFMRNGTVKIQLRQKHFGTKARFVISEVSVFLCTASSPLFLPPFPSSQILSVNLCVFSPWPVLRHLSNLAGYWPLLCAQIQWPFQCWFVNFDEEATFEPGVLERLGVKSPIPTIVVHRYVWNKYTGRYGIITTSAAYGPLIPQ